LATGFPTKRSFTPDALRELIDQFSTFKKVRMLGAAALSLAYCSAGKVDAYCEDNIMLWDVAAGIALVKAAGGWVSYEKSDTLEWGLNVRCGSTPSLFNRIGNNASN
jgi:myo-inositol-1(or 4)-monophosphatase